MSIQEVLDGKAKHHIEQADVIEFLHSLPDGCVDLLFCSPPYEKARLYLEDGKDLGIARDTEEWVVWMVEVCKAARHACKGLCCFVVEGQTQRYRYSCAPFLLVADLHRQGFHLRKPPIYRRIGIPGSGGPDWLRNDYEPIVCFTRGGKLPWSDNVAMGHTPVYGPGGPLSHRTITGERVRAQTTTHPNRGQVEPQVAAAIGGEIDLPNGSRLVRHPLPDGQMQTKLYRPPDLANPGNLIDCGATGGGNLGSSLAHENEAPFPESLAEFFIRSFCPKNGICCDPYSGSGTTAAVAVRWGRRFVGCDLRQSQVELTRRRLDEERSLFDAAEQVLRQDRETPAVEQERTLFSDPADIDPN